MNTPDWIVDEIKLSGTGKGVCRWHVRGANLSDGGRSFSWTVPDVDDPRYALTPRAQAQLADLVIPAPRAPIAFWHPALPEVAEVDIERTGSFVRCRSWLRKVYGLIPVDVFAKRTLTAAALLLLLAAPAFAAEPCKVNVQTCNVAQCAFLPGIGQVTGGLISNAHPKNETELDLVKGIGPKKLETLRPCEVSGREHR